MLILATWKKANSDPVCFEARDNKYGSFRAPSNGNVASIKLVHLYGYVSCKTDNPDYWSFWGCGHYLIDFVNVVITSSINNHVILPPAELMKYDYAARKWAKVPGYNSFSTEIVLSRFSPAFHVLNTQQFRLWYGEDLEDYHEDNNGGKVCADVYMLYV